jgi:hypothetical protein
MLLLWKVALVGGGLLGTAQAQYDNSTSATPEAFNAQIHPTPCAASCTTTKWKTEICYETVLSTTTKTCYETVLSTTTKICYETVTLPTTVTVTIPASTAIPPASTITVTATISTEVDVTVTSLETTTTEQTSEKTYVYYMDI